MLYQRPNILYLCRDMLYLRLNKLYLGRDRLQLNNYMWYQGILMLILQQYGIIKPHSGTWTNVWEPRYWHDLIYSITFAKISIQIT